jgi:hypothetical protein
MRYNLGVCSGLDGGLFGGRTGSVSRSDTVIHIIALHRERAFWRTSGSVSRRSGERRQVAPGLLYSDSSVSFVTQGLPHRQREPQSLKPPCNV